MSAGRLAGAVALVLMALLPLVASEYMLHIAIQILIWGFVYTAWSMMGRFGLTSFGHGAFLGVGAYLPALLWNFYGLTPWLGIPAGMLLAVLLALVIGYPSFRLARRRSLLCAGDISFEPGRAVEPDRGARCDRRLARHDA